LVIRKHPVLPGHVELSRWRDTLRLWGELAESTDHSIANTSRTGHGVVGTNTSAVTPGILL
jgi:hypothetical protein